MTRAKARTIRIFIQLVSTVISNQDHQKFEVLRLISFPECQILNYLGNFCLHLYKQIIILDFPNLKNDIMKEPIRYTALLPTIQKNLIQKNFESSAKIESQIFTQILYLNVIGKDIGTYVTDLYSSIQLEYAEKNMHPSIGRLLRDPTNRYTTNYYFIKDNQWHPFNCNQRILDRDHPRCQSTTQKADKTPYHAYQPQFYFGKQFPNFCVQKDKGKTYVLPCIKIHIYKWRFRIVNVNFSGWYAPVIQAIDFKLDKQPYREDFRWISCVIYEDRVRLLMEKLRLKDLRSKKLCKSAHEEQQISMLYFLKDAMPIKGRPNYIFKADKGQNFLLYDEQSKIKYVLFGEADGLLPLSQKMAESPLCENKIKLMSMESLQILFNKQEVSKPEEQEPYLWSSSDEDGEVQVEANNPIPIEPMVDENEQSDDEEEDPLRRVYLKEFKKLNLRT